MSDLSSQWLGLNPHLVASFWEVNRNGKRMDESKTVKAPLMDANFEASLKKRRRFALSFLSAGYEKRYDRQL